MSNSLLRSIAQRWHNSETLCALIPFERVFTGRIPQTELYRLPYCSVLAPAGAPYRRTDKTRYSHGPVSFHIWCDDASLEFGEKVAEAITDEYADQCWPLGDGAQVIDMLDEGEPSAYQTDMPNVKAWEVVKLFTACIMRLRVTDETCCGGSVSSETFSAESYSDSQGSSQGSSGQ